jgi:hypothetical protein
MPTGTITKLEISWLSDCEYQLTNRANPKTKTLVKITSVNKDFYNCVVLYNGRTTEYKIEKIDNGN